MICVQFILAFDRLFRPAGGDHASAKRLSPPGQGRGAKDPNLHEDRLVAAGGTRTAEPSSGACKRKGRYHSLHQSRRICLGQTEGPSSYSHVGRIRLRRQLPRIQPSPSAMAPLCPSPASVRLSVSEISTCLSTEIANDELAWIVGFK